MVLKLFIIIFLINNVICTPSFDKMHHFENALENTNNFFRKIKLEYGEKTISKDVLNTIDKKIMEYITHVRKIISTRNKRDLSENFDTGISVLNGFNENSDLNFNGAEDVQFFSFQYGLETLWFTVVLDTTKVTLHQIKNVPFTNFNGLFYNVGSYSLINGKQVIVNSSNLGALLIIQNYNGSVLILHFTKTLDQYNLQPIQDFELYDMTDLTIWNGMNQLHLGIASRENLSIYTWYGNYFDLIQVIHIGTKKLVPFQSKGFMYLAATGSMTLIFKYSLQFNKFLIIQRLPGSEDISSFELSEGHFTEHFLSLSLDSSTIMYKEMHNRFVPLQQIYSGKFIVPIISRKAIVLLTLHNDTITAYQYDGWRFVQLNTKVPDIHKFHHVVLHGKELLLMKHKNKKWILMHPIWIKAKSCTNLLKDIRTWIINIKREAKKTIGKAPDLERPIRILKGHIKKLYVHNINEQSSQKLKDASKNFRQLASRFQEQNTILKHKLHPKNLNFTSLQAKKVSINCKRKCKVHRLSLAKNAEVLSKLKVLKDKNQVFNFEKLTAKEIKKWKCPRLSFRIEDVIVEKSINGISLSYLEKNALKVIGNQEITEKHTLVNLDTKNVSFPLDVASFMTSQELKIKELKVKELNLREGGILLPSNASSTTVTGSIDAPKLKVQGIVYLTGKITGDWINRLPPVIFVSEPMILHGDFMLENAKFEDIKSMNFISNKLGSVKNILSNAIPLHSNVSVSLIISSENMKWNNISLRGEQKWITANSESKINITGRKQFLHNIRIPMSSYTNLRIPQIKVNVCAASIIAPEIKSSVLTVNSITAKNLTSSQVFGAIGKKYSNDNSTSSFKYILPGERYSKNVTVRKILVTRMNNVNLTELESLTNRWIKPDILNHSIEAVRLKASILESPIRFDREMNNSKMNIILEQNAHIETINNIHFTDFLTNAIKISDMISLQNITFNNGFSTNHMHATHLPLSLMEIKKGPNLHKKIISGNLKANSINLPHSFEVIQTEYPVNIYIDGSVTFPLEPTIININNNKLEELLTQIWLAKNWTIFYGKNLHIKVGIMKGNVTLNNSMGTLNPETWKNISKRVLSKTKLQEIKTRTFLKNVEVLSITGSDTSVIKSTVSEFNEMFYNTLLKSKDKEVKAAWTFDTLKVLGKLSVNGKVNNMDLKKDVMRHDLGKNIVTARKRITVMTAENINGYNFDKWAENAVAHSKKNITVKGHKTFNTVTINNINVSRTVMGQTIVDMLSKSRNQTISGQKNILGHVNASELIINGLVNDVNLTDLINRQLKKNRTLITIASEIELENILTINGDLTINGSYSGVEMTNFYKAYPNIIPTTQKMMNSFYVAHTTNAALRNRAMYINKLELVNDTHDIIRGVVSVQRDQCKARSFLSECINEHVTNSKLNTSNFILLKTMQLNEDELTVLVKPESVSIYVYDNTANSLVRLKELYIPKILDAYAEPVPPTLWIILRLPSQTLVLHNQLFDEMREHILPATDVFNLSYSPNYQLLLLLSDGVWILEGLATPRNIIGFPLQENVEILHDGYDYYVKCDLENSTRLMKLRNVGN